MSAFASADDVNLGTDRATGRPVDIGPKLLRTGLHLVGPPGMGKTNLILHMIAQIARRWSGPLFVFAVKGDLLPHVRDWAVNAGQASRLVFFDPADPEWVTGYDPLKPNGLDVADHARHVREALRAGLGQAHFDATQQLGRFLYAVLYVLREREWTLDYATALLRPGSALLEQTIPKIEDEEVRADLALFRSLPFPRQEQLGASTLARILGFLTHPRVRRMLTQRTHSIDLATMIQERKIVLVNLEEYRPLSLDDIRILGRMLVNDLLRAVFHRADRRQPVTLVLDEAQTWVTRDLCTALSQGREMNLWTILAHHYLTQFVLEGDDRQVLDAVLRCAKTKILFGQGWVPEYDEFMRHFFIDQFDPKTIKHQETALESEYVETTRVIPSTSHSEAVRVGLALPSSRTSGGAHSRQHTESHATTDGETETVTVSDGGSSGDTILPDGTHVPTDGFSWSTASGSIEQRSTTSGVADGESDTETWSRSRGRVPSVGYDRSRSQIEAVHPFQEIHQHRVPVATQFESLDEFLTRQLQATIDLREGECVVKAPGQPAVFVETPLFTTPALGREALQRVRDTLYREAPYARRVTDVALSQSSKLELQDTHDTPVTNTVRRRGRKSS